VSCDAIQERLSELALGHALDGPERWDAELREHALGCGDCAGHARFLRALVGSLESMPAEPARAVVVAGARERARRALRAQAPPPRFARELAGAFAIGVLALPLAFGDAWLVAREGTALLSPWLPSAVLTWLGVVYFGSLALTTGALYAAIPLAVGWAHRERA
jgi:hypothetical protein